MTGEHPEVVSQVRNYSFPRHREITSPLPLSFGRRGVPAGGVRILVIHFTSFSLLSWGNFGFLFMLSRTKARLMALVGEPLLLRRLVKNRADERGCPINSPFCQFLFAIGLRGTPKLVWGCTRYTSSGKIGWYHLLGQPQNVPLYSLICGAPSFSTDRQTFLVASKHKKIQ